MKEIEFKKLRMIATSSGGVYRLEISIASGFVDFLVTIGLNQQDFEVIGKDEERAAFLHAALHRPFQRQKTALGEAEQRQYLDVILHGSESEVESFLTDKDHGAANGAISNMIRITCGREQSLMRQGNWFN